MRCAKDWDCNQEKDISCTDCEHGSRYLHSWRLGTSAFFVPDGKPHEMTERLLPGLVGVTDPGEALVAVLAAVLP